MVAPLRVVSKHREQGHCPRDAHKKPERQTPPVREAMFPRIALIDRARCQKPHGPPPTYLSMCSGALYIRQKKRHEIPGAASSRRACLVIAAPVDTRMWNWRLSRDTQ